MAPKAADLGSLKTEGGLAKLNELLATRSYVAGGPSATPEDLAALGMIQRVPDREEYPHVVRWFRHVAALKAAHAGNPSWVPGVEVAGGEAVKKGRAPGKEKVVLEVDCKVVKVTDVRKPAGKKSRGAGSQCFAGAEKGKDRYYITTAINYCNGWPHIGHAYEALTADVFARFHRMLGQDVFYMTGADEHGQKIAEKATEEKITPLQLCDRYCDGFMALNERLNISNDFYVRTTRDQHKETAQSIWKKCKENGDIFLDRYEGWYLVREERFITDQEAEEWNFVDKFGSGLPLTKMSEPSFFFRLSKYQQKIIDLLESNKEFIQPEQYRGEILERLKNMEMRDLSISRGNFSWGVECPEDAVDGKKHVMYVWFDALTNYVSGVRGNDPKDPLSRFWPANMHIVGKDIVWFHTVIWPSMLMCAGMPLPKSVVVHGFISGSDGRKMSKSFGNVIDPHDMLDILPCDTLRWYLCRESQYGDDVKFSTESIRLMHNSELCDNLGNLVNRAINLCGGAVPECQKGLVQPPFKLAELKAGVRTAFESYRLSDAAELTVRACSATNKWIADLEPWKMKDEALKPKRDSSLRLLLESVYVLAHFFAAFIPEAADAIFKKVGAAPMAIPKLSDDFTNLKAGSPVFTGSILFEQLEAVKDEKPAAAAAPAAKPEGKGKGKGKGDAKEAAKAAAKPAAAKGAAKKGGAAPPADDPNQPLFSKLDIRVGKVVKAWHHPEADRLFVEEIDVGDAEGPRQIVSGLREHYTLEQFQGRKLLAVCNMKPSKLMGVMSSGMVLCAKNPEAKVVELLSVPDDLEVGTRVLPEGVPGTWAPITPEQVKKQKVWEAVAAIICTDKDKVAMFDGKPLVTASGAKFLAPTQASVAIG